MAEPANELSDAEEQYMDRPPEYDELAEATIANEALVRTITALSAALEQAVKTCSDCAGTGRIIRQPPDETDAEFTVYAFKDCARCWPWRELLKP